MPVGNRPTIAFTVDGSPVEVPDDGGSLLAALRDHVGIRSAKDGCSPQGQCGCCTVLVDGQPRVACVTPTRRVAGRSITTAEAVPGADRWARALCATGGSQCGFCTPGIVARLASVVDGGSTERTAGSRALLAHLCRCTGWLPVLDAFDLVVAGEVPDDPFAGRDPALAARRAAIEGGIPQAVGPDVALGRAPFAADTAPPGCLVAVPDGAGGWVVGDTLTEARAAAGKVQGRRTTLAATPPLQLPPGDWAVRLRTSWVEPAYLETDASWCVPGGEPSTPLANGGAFGGKVTSPLPAAARALADRHGRAVLATWSREDVTRWGPKRPPVAAGVGPDGTGVVRVARADGIGERLRAVPGLRLAVEEVDLPGPPVSLDPRASGWAEATLLAAGLAGSPEVTVTDPFTGATATASIDGGTVHLRVAAGAVLDEVVLRSYLTGAAHQALGWVTSERLAVTSEGEVLDLTIRSFGILRSVDMPAVVIEVVDHAGGEAGGEPVRAGDAAFVAVAAAAWVAQGCPPDLPTGRTITS